MTIVDGGRGFRAFLYSKGDQQFALGIHTQTLANGSKIAMAVFGGHLEFECLQLLGCNRTGKWNVTFHVNPRGSDDISFGIKDEGELHGVLTLMAVNRSSVNLPLSPREVVSTVTVSLVA